MATGLLLIGINSATKLLTYLVGASKTYEATIRLGASTITDDAEGETLEVASADAVRAITAEQIESALESLRGEIMQVPSSVSAIKIDGERAYAKVRGGDEVKLAARPISIFRFDVTSEPQVVQSEGGVFLDFNATIECSSGTYIRALARDIGRQLAVGGHLTALRRTKINNYAVEDAQQIDGLSRDSLKVMPMVTAAQRAFAIHNVSDQEVIDLRHGKRIASNGLTGSAIAAVNNGELVAMLESVEQQLKSTVVFAGEPDA
jgi:tRNA pseudouridine55 synthase